MQLGGVATFVNIAIGVVIDFVPILIFVALSPAISSLADSGRANSLAGSVVLWYLFTSFLAGLLGLSISTLLFGLSFSNSSDTSARTIMTLLTPGDSLNASRPLFAILLAICFGLLGAKWKLLRIFLENVQGKFFYCGSKLKLIIVPFVLILGISVGVRFGAQLGLTNYLLMTAYTFLLCLTWTIFYVFVLLKLGKRYAATQVIRDYFLPTAVFAAGTCSSLLTLPVNLANIKKQGVSPKIADFVLPVGSVINLDASALAYVAYPPHGLACDCFVYRCSSWPASWNGDRPLECYIIRFRTQSARKSRC